MPVEYPKMSVYSVDREVPTPPKTSGSATAAHVRGTVTNAAQSLNTIAAVPQRTTNPPHAVTIQVEAAAVGNVFVTVDATSTPSATLGLQVPVAPQFLRIPYRDGILNDTIKLISTQASTACQFYYEWMQSSQ